MLPFKEGLRALSSFCLLCLCRHDPRHASQHQASCRPSCSASCFRARCLKMRKAPTEQRRCCERCDDFCACQRRNVNSRTFRVSGAARRTVGRYVLELDAKARCKRQCHLTSHAAGMWNFPCPRCRNSFRVVFSEQFCVMVRMLVNASTPLRAIKRRIEVKCSLRGHLRIFCS